MGAYDEIQENFLDAQQRIQALQGDDAARVIQRATRRRFVRKEAQWEVQHRLREIKDKDRAAVTVQGVFRSKHARQEAAYRRAMRTLQARGRGLFTRKQALLDQLCMLEGVYPELAKNAKEREAANEKRAYFAGMRIGVLHKYYDRRKQEEAEKEVAAAEAKALATEEAAAAAANAPKAAVVKRRRV